MKAETLNKRINEALNRLEEGKYGYCFECGEEISEARLRALPFAVRCKDCEEARETRRAARADDCTQRGAPVALLRHVELTAS
jgi:RNA polymerase-binding transcription factor DksA